MKTVDALIKHLWTKRYVPLDVIVFLTCMMIPTLWVSIPLWVIYLIFVEKKNLRLSEETSKIDVNTKDFTGSRIYVKFGDGHELNGTLERQQDGKYTVKMVSKEPDIN